MDHGVADPNAYLLDKALVRIDTLEKMVLALVKRIRALENAAGISVDKSTPVRSGACLPP